ncbi:MAG: DUF2163 domain-containing protein [Maricaulaceae bacterium]
MRVLNPDFAAAASAEASRLCWCYRLTRADGVVFGFTNHDGVLVFDGTRFDPSLGMDSAPIETVFEFTPGLSAASGALGLDGLNAEDLSAGRFDGAVLEAFLVDWRNPDARLGVWRARLGAVRLADGEFEAELRGPAAALDGALGRVVSRYCDAELGDARCGVNLTGALSRGGAVTQIETAERFVVSGLEADPTGWFDHGVLAWTAGANLDRSSIVAVHQVGIGGSRLELREAPGRPIAVGDRFLLAAGCDKRFETCKAKFANAINFRGFPHVPPPDDVVKPQLSTRL